MHHRYPGPAFYEKNFTKTTLRYRGSGPCRVTGFLHISEEEGAKRTTKSALIEKRGGGKKSTGTERLRLKGAETKGKGTHTSEIRN